MTVRGWVYVLINKAMPALVKVGYSTKDPSLRADELNGTGLPYQFQVAYDVLVIGPRDVEQQVHRQLELHKEAKEFFRVTPSEAATAIRSVISSQGKAILSQSHELPTSTVKTSSPTKQKNKKYWTQCGHEGCEREVPIGNSFCPEHVLDRFS